MAKILLVDDEDLFRESTAGLLKERGHDVRSACDSTGAVEIAHHFRPDVLVCDLVLKGDVDGLGVATVLRAKHAHLPVILISGFPSSDWSGEAQRRGVFAYVQKPCDIRVLDDAIRNASDYA